MSEWHPYAKLFPMLSDPELQSLADDIREHGLREPITIDREERIIDGRNRAAACIIAGVDPTYEPFVGNDREVLAFVVSKNLKRRHLNESQRAMVAADIANLTHGGHVPHRGKTASSKEDAERRLPSPPVSQADAAKMLNVSERMVARAKRVQREAASEVQEAIREGQMKVTAVDRALSGKTPGGTPIHPEAQLDSNGEPKRIGVGVLRANEAIDCLIRIPKNDPLRKRGFQIVTDWIKANK